MKTLLLPLFLAISSMLKSQTDSFTLNLCSRLWATNEPGPSLILTTAGVNPSLTGYNADSTCGSLRFSPAISANNYCPRATIPQQDYPNGITIRDALILREHLLGIEPIQTNAVKFAADLNRSGTINTGDLDLLWKTMLGKIQMLPGGYSWRSIFENETYPDPANPFGVTCPGYSYMSPAAADTSVFYAVKLGDLDGDARADGNYLPPTGVSTVRFRIPDVPMIAGNTYDIPVSLKPTWTSLGLQMAFRLDASNLTWQSLENGLLALEENIHYTQTGSQVVRLAVVLEEPSLLSQGLPLFTLRVKALSTGNLSNFMESLPDSLPSLLLDLNRTLHPANIEFYATSNAQLPESAGISPQVAPNPFQQMTTIHFVLDEPSTVTLELRDANGRLLSTQEAFFYTGLQQFILHGAEKPGLLYYTLRSSRAVFCGKILQQP